MLFLWCQYIGSNDIEEAKRILLNIQNDTYCSKLQEYLNNPEAFIEKKKKEEIEQKEKKDKNHIPKVILENAYKAAKEWNEEMWWEAILCLENKKRYWNAALALLFLAKSTKNEHLEKYTNYFHYLISLIEPSDKTLKIIYQMVSSENNNFTNFLNIFKILIRKDLLNKIKKEQKSSRIKNEARKKERELGGVKTQKKQKIPIENILKINDPNTLLKYSWDRSVDECILILEQYLELG